MKIQIVRLLALGFALACIAVFNGGCAYKAYDANEVCAASMGDTNANNTNAGKNGNDYAHQGSYAHQKSRYFGPAWPDRQLDPCASCDHNKLKPVSTAAPTAQPAPVVQNAPVQPAAPQTVVNVYCDRSPTPPPVADTDVEAPQEEPAPPTQQQPAAPANAQHTSYVLPQQQVPMNDPATVPADWADSPRGRVCWVRFDANGRHFGAWCISKFSVDGFHYFVDEKTPIYEYACSNGSMTKQPVSYGDYIAAHDGRRVRS